MRKGKKAEARTRVVTDIADVPNGWVRINDVAERGADGGHARAAFLSAAHRDGRLPAVKVVRTTGDFITGPVYVPRDEAIRLLESRHRRPDPEPQSPELPPMPEKASGDLLARVAARLDSVAARIALLEETVAMTLAKVDALANATQEWRENGVRWGNHLMQRLQDLQAAAELRMESAGYEASNN